MNILISVDSAYLEHAKTMLYSLRLHNQGEITVYLLNYRLTDEEIASFKTYLHKKCRMNLEVITVPPELFQGFPIERFSIEMYYRILAQFLLPPSVDRVLWLDADIIVRKDITAFYKQDFENHAYVVCPDVADTLDWFKQVKETLLLPQEYVYFNSGVMLMNLSWLRENTSAESLLAHAQAMVDKLQFPDQDILNTYYKDHVKYADWKRYNYQTIYVKRIEKEELKNIAILHYCVKIKPWMCGCADNLNRHYFKVRFRQGKWKEALTVYARKWKHQLLG